MAKKKIDFTGVESFVKAEEGEHIAVLKSMEEKVASTGADMLVAVFEITKGTSTGARIYHNFVLSEKALWNLKGYLQAIGINAEGRIVLDINKLIGRVCIIDVVHVEYNGSVRANIDGFKRFAVEQPDDYEEDEDDFDEEDDFEETPKKEVKKKSAQKKDEPEEDEDEEDVDYSALTNKELRVLIRKKGIEIPSGTKKAGLLALLAGEVEDDEDDEDDDWDEE